MQWCVCKLKSEQSADLACVRRVLRETPSDDASELCLIGHSLTLFPPFFTPYFIHLTALERNVVLFFSIANIYSLVYFSDKGRDGVIVGRSSLLPVFGFVCFQ